MNRHTERMGGDEKGAEEMNMVPKETIEVIAQTLGVNNLSPAVLPNIAADVEYRVREIMQEAIKCMHHSRRTTLTSGDVDNALKLRNLQPLYGFNTDDSLRFKRAPGHKDLFYTDDKAVELKDVITAPLPKPPADTTVLSHWLAIEGVQPAIPENPVEVLAVPSDSKKNDHKEDGALVDIKLPTKNSLSRELQLYFGKVTELAVSRPDSTVFKVALKSLAMDYGLHPLVPYFTYFISEEVSRNLNSYSVLFALMRMARSLLLNQHMNIDPYLHQLMPPIVTCLVAKRSRARSSDSHWELRTFTAILLASICKRYGRVYHNLQPRVTRTLLHALLDPSKLSSQHYGAIQGLAALGRNAVRLLLFPNLESYLQLLKLDMQVDKQKNEMKRQEAWRVYGALSLAAGAYMYDILKLFFHLLFPPSHKILKRNAKLVTTMPNKRKASTSNMMHQPPFKKMAIDGPMGVRPVNSLPDMQVTGGGFSNPLRGRGGSFPSIPQQMRNDNNTSGRSVRRERVGGSLPIKMSAIRGQFYKDMEFGRLPPLLAECFGDSLLPFIPTPPLSFFL